MRTTVVILFGTLAMFRVSFVAAGAQPGPAADPLAWEPAYWDQMMLSIRSARDRGEPLEAEKLCARVIPYVEVQAVKALREYADFLDSQQPGTGADARARAERLAQVKAVQARATKPGSSYLGFAPSDELTGYADALQRSQRQSDAQTVRALAAAYKYSQDVYVRRTLLIGQGKDPRGEC